MRIKDFSNSAKLNFIMKAIKENLIWNMYFLKLR